MLPSNSIMPPKTFIPPRNPDICEECGQYPKSNENGIEHPYCSRACAKRAAVSRAQFARPQRTTRNGATYFDDRCEECGLHPKAIERGYKHRYCSQTCAQKSKLRPPMMNVQIPVATDLCPGCGKYPREIKGGNRYTYCSKTCARRCSTNDPGICALLGCAAAASPAVGGFCSMTHVEEWSHSRQIHGNIPAVQPPRILKKPQRHRILFYHKHNPHYGFTNFSYHPISYEGKIYPTSEHLFQSFKFQKYRPHIAEHIRTYSNKPSVAFSEARKYQHQVRPDWNQIKIEKMNITLWHKFTQHRDLKEELLATGNIELVEDSDKDAFWGVGPDGRGRNELGKALERLRSALRLGGGMKIK